MPYTLAQYETEIRALLGEVTASAVRWTTAEINEWTNQGQRDIASKALCIESSSSINTVDGTREYTYTGIAVLHVAIAGGKGLRKILPKQVGHFGLTGDNPQYWYEWGSKIGIDPVPKAVHVVDVYTAIDSTDLTGAGTSTLPIAFHNLITLFAFHRGLLKDRRFSQAASVYNQYINELQYTRSLYKERVIDSASDFKPPTQALPRQ